MDDVLLFIKKEQPDIIGLQEVYNGSGASWERKFRSMEVFRNELDYPHEHFAPAFLERTAFGNVEQGNAILSRFPIMSSAVTFFDQPYSEREDIPEYYEKTPRNLQCAVVETPAGPLHIFNTQGIWGTDPHDNIRRLDMGRTIAREIASAGQFILGGDFNVKERSDTIGHIERHGRNVFAGQLKTSFNLREKTSPTFVPEVVDMVFTHPQMNLIKQSCPDIDISDHLPLLVTVELANFAS